MVAEPREHFCNSLAAIGIGGRAYGGERCAGGGGGGSHGGFIVFALEAGYLFIWMVTASVFFKFIYARMGVGSGGNGFGAALGSIG